MNEIINDLNIVIDAMEAGSQRDAIQMIRDIQEDLKIIALLG